MHPLIADRLDETTLDRARMRVAGWLRDGGPVDPRWAREWEELLSSETGAVAAAIRRDEPGMTQIRQTTPFAGALSNAERWRVLREVS